LLSIPVKQYWLAKPTVSSVLFDFSYSIPEGLTQTIKSKVCELAEPDELAILANYRNLI